MTASRRVAASALTLALAATLAACGDDGTESPSTSGGSSSSSKKPLGSPSTTVKRDELQNDMKNKLNAQGSTVESVDCPDPVEAKIGASTVCHVKAKGGESKDYEVTVTSVNGKDVGYRANPK